MLENYHVKVGGYYPLFVPNGNGVVEVDGVPKGDGSDGSDGPGDGIVVVFGAPNGDGSDGPGDGLVVVFGAPNGDGSDGPDGPDGPGDGVVVAVEKLVLVELPTKFTDGAPNGDGSDGPGDGVVVAFGAPNGDGSDGPGDGVVVFGALNGDDTAVNVPESGAVKGLENKFEDEVVETLVLVELPTKFTDGAPNGDGSDGPGDGIVVVFGAPNGDGSDGPGDGLVVVFGAPNGDGSDGSAGPDVPDGPGDGVVVVFGAPNGDENAVNVAVSGAVKGLENKFEDEVVEKLVLVELPTKFTDGEPNGDGSDGSDGPDGPDGPGDGVVVVFGAPNGDGDGPGDGVVVIFGAPNGDGDGDGDGELVPVNGIENSVDLGVEAAFDGALNIDAVADEDVAKLGEFVGILHDEAIEVVVGSPNGDDTAVNVPESGSLEIQLIQNL
ncbi:hypothetical protein DICPUDRAFT_157983 [Dictyostelium purpureum]|uniref:Uncharacterized protein n=1 Tax=Dictyostelium purpureum TaxID=5786 RepID=F1A0I4_DICPU|nr:uncharacterized protein DICPUDRAFT_157983 [Dictyostelium purpureum]EGC30295.1 hypothetical protein DICPUDRAFT_157983 [Dictyostelium purpureum]|eukprot:XP_003293174.1 hypothetical protein DICPUDRAFT_157983 [Dictyostelium purpureum]